MSVGMAAGKLLLASPGSVLRRLDIEDGPPASARATSADIKFTQSLSDPPRGAEAIIVGEFLSPLNGLFSENEYPTIFIENFAVGFTGVIYEPGVISSDAGIDRGHFIHREEKGMVAFHRIFIVALQFKVRPDPFAHVFNNACSFGDLDQRESSTPLNPRLANNEIAVVPFAVILHI